MHSHDEAYGLLEGQIARPSMTCCVSLRLPTSSGAPSDGAWQCWKRRWAMYRNESGNRLQMSATMTTPKVGHKRPWGDDRSPSPCPGLSDTLTRAAAGCLPLRFLQAVRLRGSPDSRGRGGDWLTLEEKGKRALLIDVSTRHSLQQDRLPRDRHTPG